MIAWIGEAGTQTALIHVTTGILAVCSLNQNNKYTVFQCKPPTPSNIPKKNLDGFFFPEVEGGGGFVSKKNFPLQGWGAKMFLYPKKHTF